MNGAKRCIQKEMPLGVHKRPFESSLLAQDDAYPNLVIPVLLGNLLTLVDFSTVHLPHHDPCLTSPAIVYATKTEPCFTLTGSPPALAAWIIRQPILISMQPHWCPNVSVKALLKRCDLSMQVHFHNVLRRSS